MDRLFGRNSAVRDTPFDPAAFEQFMEAMVEGPQPTQDPIMRSFAEFMHHNVFSADSDAADEEHDDDLLERMFHHLSGTAMPRNVPFPDHALETIDDMVTDEEELARGLRMTCSMLEGSPCRAQQLSERPVVLAAFASNIIAPPSAEVREAAVRAAAQLCNMHPPAVHALVRTARGGAPQLLSALSRTAAAAPRAGAAGARGARMGGPAQGGGQGEHGEAAATWQLLMQLCAAFPGEAAAVCRGHPALLHAAAGALNSLPTTSSSGSRGGGGGGGSGGGGSHRDSSGQESISGCAAGFLMELAAADPEVAATTAVIGALLKLLVALDASKAAYEAVTSAIASMCIRPRSAAALRAAASAQGRLLQALSRAAAHHCYLPHQAVGRRHDRERRRRWKQRQQGRRRGADASIQRWRGRVRRQLGEGAAQLGRIGCGAHGGCDHDHCDDAG